ncbi:MAG: NIPSNAP family protein [Candidatus Tectomicrobia bacterium]|uniref:NIPSNAP family protein n=1 Tax=Tectimicrobiota bacterium TaxID=2528274 RepID=A0A938AZY5_UNCTE|nr:NIPSNAP family protein [Candidatus Tectomicrobia bacterium]
MIYEFRTYDLKPRGVPEFERAFGEKLPGRQTYSPLCGLWHTEAGPLNQVLHVWPYEDIAQRTDIRAKAVAAGAWPPQAREPVVLNMNSEILYPAPFTKVPAPGKVGPLYELRIYQYEAGAIPKVIEAWGKAIDERQKYSPLVGAWYSELGNLNRWFHMWAYESFEHRLAVREETRAKGVWPPAGGVAPLRQENKILMPAACSPLQ